MYLHQDKEQFKSIITTVSDSLKIDKSIVEKDYYLTMVLKLLQNYESEDFKMLFKGGTSLSKCYKIINRFSEDIDLTWNGLEPSKSRREKFKTYIKEVCKELDIALLDDEYVWPKKSITEYRIGFPRIDENVIGKKELTIETSFFTKAYPARKMEMISIIGDYMLQAGSDVEILKEYSLEPFSLSVQDISRTLIDKIFAICDYYYLGKINRHSRHLYDISEIIKSGQVNLDKSFKKLFDQVREDRLIGNSETTISADPNCDITKTLEEIINTHVFEEDWNKTSVDLLLEKDISYDDAIYGIKVIMDSGILR